MSDDLIQRLRSVNGTEAPYANEIVRPWCHEAANEIERLQEENKQLRKLLREQSEFNKGTIKALADAVRRRG